jgi:hypothetical protein
MRRGAMLAFPFVLVVNSSMFHFDSATSGISSSNIINSKFGGSGLNELRALNASARSGSVVHAADEHNGCDGPATLSDGG